MARYKPMHNGLKLLPVDFDQQVIPGSLEHALCYLVDHELDLDEFHARYHNDDEGAPAFDPAALINGDEKGVGSHFFSHIECRRRTTRHMKQLPTSFCTLLSCRVEDCGGMIEAPLMSDSLTGINWTRKIVSRADVASGTVLPYGK